VIYSIASAFAIYFVVWWLVLFVTLPFGVRSQAEEGVAVPGSDPGAPTAPLMLKKLIWTTIVSAILFAVCMYGFYAGWFNLNRMVRLMGLPF